MATKEAAIKLTLKQGAFNSGLKTMEAQTRATGTRMGAALAGPMRAGLANAQAKLKGMLASMTGTMKNVATLGGAFAMGGMIKSAISFQAKIRDIAFGVNKTGRAFVDWRDIMRDVRAVAQRTALDSDQLADAYKKVFQATGDADFAKASLDAIGTTAAATGDDVDQLANVAQLLQRKFGATAETLPEMMAKFTEKVGAGGLSLDDLGTKFGAMAGEAAAAGFKGEEGLSQLLGVMTALDSRVGEKSTPGMKRLLEVLKGGSADLKALEKASGVKFDADTTALDKVEKLLTGKGRKAIELKLTGDSRTVFDELVKPFDEAQKQALQSGASAKDAQQQGLDAFRRSMEEAGKSTLNFDKLQKQAQENMDLDPGAKLRQSIEKVKEAFNQPEMIQAINSLATNLPVLAEQVAKFASFAAENPGTTAAGVVAGKVGGSFIAGAAGSAVAGKLAGAGAAGAAGTGAAGVGAAGATGIAGTLAAVAAPVLTLTALGHAATGLGDRALGLKGGGLSAALVGRTAEGGFGFEQAMKDLFNPVQFVGKAGNAVGNSLLELGLLSSPEKMRKSAFMGPFGTDEKDVTKTVRDNLGMNPQAPAAAEAAEEVGALGKESKSAAGETKALGAAIKSTTEALRGLAAAATDAKPGGGTRGPKPLGTVNPGSNPRSG